MPTNAKPRFSPNPVIVAGNATVHSGRIVGKYASGQTKYVRRCGTSRNDRHFPTPVAPGTPITCRRCLAKLAQLNETTPEGR